MNKLEMKKIEVELLAVSAAKGSLELRIEQAKFDIETYENAITIQIKREDELKKQLADAKGENK